MLLSGLATSGSATSPTGPGLGETTTVAEALAAARLALKRSPLDLPTREAALLLAHVLGSNEIELLTHGERRLPDDRRQAFHELLERRLGGEPVAYLVGRREFYGRELLTDPRALIPRPETEHLVELALELDLPRRAHILDVGTGTGCIAVTLAAERPEWRVIACDRSPAALALATHNARRLGVAERVTPVAFDLVVSNPPYIASDELVELSPEITDFEPRQALVSTGRDGTDLTGRLLATLRRSRPGTPVAIEIGAGRLEAVTDLAARHGFTLDRVVDDYASIPRVVLLRRHSRPGNSRPESD